MKDLKPEYMCRSKDNVRNVLLVIIVVVAVENIFQINLK